MAFNRLTSIINRSLRVMFAGLLCITMLFSNALPAAAFGTNKSAPTEATDQLQGVQQETDRVARSNPLSRQATQRRAEDGLNSVQGDADKDKMYRPSNSQDADTVKGDVKDLLNNITNNN